MNMHTERTYDVMSQRLVEQILGTLLTDEEFRHQYLEGPHSACYASGFELTPVEREAAAANPADSPGGSQPAPRRQDPPALRFGGPE